MCRQSHAIIALQAAPLPITDVLITCWGQGLTQTIVCLALRQRLVLGGGGLVCTNVALKTLQYASINLLAIPLNLGFLLPTCQGGHPAAPADPGQAAAAAAAQLLLEGQESPQVLLPCPL